MADSIWIDLRTRHNEVILLEHHRPYTLFQESITSTNDPQMLMFVGAEQKTLLMKRLFLIQGRENHRKVHLFRIPGMTDSRSPVFIADCELHNIFKFRKAIIRPIPGVVDQRSILWKHKIDNGFHPDTLTSLVYTRLISPFSTTICFFVDDLGGIKATAKMLASWLTGLKVQSSDMPQSTFPRALILMKWSDHRAAFDEKLATINFLHELHLQTDLLHRGKHTDKQLTEQEFHTLLQARFSDLRVLCTPSDDAGVDEVKSWPQVKALCARILQESQDMQSRRRSMNMLFSSRHFTAFLHSACDHFVTDISTPFSFLEASRAPNPIPQDFSVHLSNFLRATSQRTIGAYVPLIASALNLDSYPPGMHHFEPVQVFRKFYHKVFQDVETELRRQKSLDCFRENVKEAFCHQVMKAFHSSAEVATIHRVILSDFPYWKNTYSNETCFSCIGRCPEHVLSCRHSLCDTCVIIHGQTDLKLPWRFLLEKCPLCQASNTKLFTVKPYTAGTRCLSVGGSSHDLIRLLNFERSLKLLLPLQDCFDFVTGSGIGAILILQVFCKGKDISDCLNDLQINDVVLSSRFSQDTTEAGSELDDKRNAYTSFVKLASSWRGNWPSKSSAPLANLKSLLGREDTLFGCCENGVKVAVVVHRLKERALDIFSNYNGMGKRLAEYNVIRPQRVKNEPLLWQVAQTASTTGEPKYHGHSFTITHNLTALTLREQDTIWSRANKYPDILFCSEETTPDFDKLVSSMFYIELLEAPLIVEVGFSCRAQIHCRLLPSQPAFILLISRLRYSRARFSYNTQVLSCVDEQLFNDGKKGLPFLRYIEFSIVSIYDEIDIKIEETNKPPQSISNCPYVLQTLIQDQGLDCVFGHRDHQRRY